jgi:hypothetical protein
MQADVISMIYKIIRTAAIVALCPLGLLSCSPAKLPSLTFQSCVQDESGIKKVYSIIQSMARDHEMEIVDNSKDAARQIESIKRTGILKENIHVTLDVGLRKNGYYKIVLGDLGMARYQILTSVFGDPHNKFDQELSKDIFKQFNQSFYTKIVPVGKGAFPLAECKE